MPRNVRIMFFKTLRLAFYRQIKKNPIFRTWSTEDILGVTDEIIDKKRHDINQFLDDHPYRLNELEIATERVVFDVLLPEINNITI